MKNKIVKITGILLVLVLMISTLAGCSSKKVERPVPAQLKTDLKDASFTLSYGQLRTVLPADKLASLFENTNEKTDDKTVEISYYEMISKYGNEEYFNDLMALVSESDIAELTANQQQVLDYFNTMINDIKATGTPKVSYYENFWINHGDDVKFKDENGNELPDQDIFRAAFRIYADTALQNIGDFLMNSEEATEHNADLTDILYVLGSKTASSLTLDDLYTEENGYPIHSSVIPTLVNDLDEKGNNAKYEEGELKGENIYVASELYRTIVVNVKPEEASVKKAFSVREKDGIAAELKKAEKYLKVNSFEIGFNPCKITTGIDAATDLMNYITYDKNMVITANVTFNGELAKYGNVIVEFPCTSSLTYNFGWPAKE